jgi:hypothetical protein
MPAFPSPPLKFRTAGFPQYGFKASLSGATCRPAPRRTESAYTRPVPRRASRLSSPFARVRSRRSDQALSPDRVRTFCVPLRERPRLSTPGVLGSGPSCVVPDHQCLLRPHPPVPQARDDFAAWPFIRRAFAVRVRLGDPRDLPYFRYRSFQACRRPYAGGFEVLSRCACAPPCQASSLCPRVATHKIPPLPAMLGGDLLFRRGIVRVMLRPVCLPRPPDWLRRDAVTCAAPRLLSTWSLPLWPSSVAGRRWESGSMVEREILHRRDLHPTRYGS